MTANAVKTALRSHARYHRQPESILQQVNLTLWTGSAGDRRASLLLGLIETATGRVCWASAGRPSIIRISGRGDGWQSLGRSCIGLGESPEAGFQQCGTELQPGEALLISTDGIRDAVDAQGRVFGEAGLAVALQGKLDLSAEELVVAAQTALRGAQMAAPDARDRSILVIKRD
jgi:sigma-B regulation protein RsbU (phosphoserine phosphatase)